MKRILTVTLMAALALFAGSAYANFCARDVVPATTLLVPYVVVSMDAAGTHPDQAGYTTYLSVTNVSSDAQIIHVNVWSADSEGILDFNQVLSGYDVWSINFADLLSGHWSAFQTSLDPDAFPNVEEPPLFRTPFEWGPDGRSAYGVADAGPDAPYGPPLAYGDYPYWTGLPVPEPTDVLPSTNCTMDQLDDVIGAQFAGLVIDGLTAPLFARDHDGCGSQPVERHVTGGWLAGLGANPLFFYVTVDLFNQCELIFPDGAGYFPQVTVKGVLPTVAGVRYENVLIGEIYWVNAGNGFSEATPAVHVESDIDADLATATVGGLGTEFMNERANQSPVHYGTYEEPLATAFGFRYFNDAPTVTSTVLLWKNRTEFNTDDTVNDCGAYVYYAWDMDEHVITRFSSCPVSPCGGSDIDPNEFPFEINVVPLTNANFDLPATYGWMLIVMPPSYGLPYVDPTPNTTLLNFEYYGWVGVRIEFGTFSAGLEAATMANAHCFETQDLGTGHANTLGINYNYRDGNHTNNTRNTWGGWW